MELGHNMYCTFLQSRFYVTATQVCLDQRTDCELLIERTPEFCVKYKHTFGLLKCAKSCGLCANARYLRSGEFRFHI